MEKGENFLCVWDYLFWGGEEVKGFNAYICKEN